MNTDRELMEWAAKAAGLPGEWVEADVVGWVWECFDAERYNGRWAPLTDDGDALRLAVKLEIGIVFIGLTVRARAPEYWQNEIEMCEIMTGDAAAKARRAIVRAAAEIAKKGQS